MLKLHSSLYLFPYYDLNGLFRDIYLYFRSLNESMCLKYVCYNKSNCYNLCLSHLCGSWSNPFYCISRGQTCLDGQLSFNF